jgi:hypothetical protein
MRNKTFASGELISESRLESSVSPLSASKPGGADGMQGKERWMLEKKLVQQVQYAKAMPQPVPAGDR